MDRNRLAAALRDFQFRSDIKRNALSAMRGAAQGLTTDALGAPVDLVNMALTPFGLGSQNPVGGSNWLAGKAVKAGLLDPPENNLQYNAGRFLGPVVGMKAPDLAGKAVGLLGNALSDVAAHSNRLSPYAGQAGAFGTIDGLLYRGGKSAGDGKFFSRDAEYAKGFDKGHFGQYHVTASKALDFRQPVTPDEVAPIIAALERGGEKSAASMIRDAVAEDGGAHASHLYMWLERLAKNAPETYLKAAGIDAIDTGRDVRLLRPELARPYSN